MNTSPNTRACVLVVWTENGGERRVKLQRGQAAWAGRHEGGGWRVFQQRCVCAPSQASNPLRSRRAKSALRRSTAPRLRQNRAQRRAVARFALRVEVPPRDALALHVLNCFHPSVLQRQASPPRRRTGARLTGGDLLRPRLVVGVRPPSHPWAASTRAGSSAASGTGPTPASPASGRSS